MKDVNPNVGHAQEALQREDACVRHGGIAARRVRTDRRRNPAGNRWRRAELVRVRPGDGLVLPDQPAVQLQRSAELPLERERPQHVGMWYTGCDAGYWRPYVYA